MKQTPKKIETQIKRLRKFIDDAGDVTIETRVAWAIGVLYWENHDPSDHVYLNYFAEDINGGPVIGDYRRARAAVQAREPT